MADQALSCVLVPGEGFEPPTFGLQIPSATIFACTSPCVTGMQALISGHFSVCERIETCVPRIASA
jgi:hypothetical protein